MSRYQIRTQARNGAGINLLEGATSRRLTRTLNRPPEFTCSIPADRGSATDLGLNVGQSEAVITRNGQPVESVFQLASVNVNADADQAMIELSYLGLLSYLQDALVFGRASAYTGTTLPWTWINTFQSRTGGSYGITQGAVVGSPASRSRLLEADGALLDEIIQLSESGAGFDFAINAQRQYVEWHGAGRGENNGYRLAWGENILSYDFEVSAAPGEIVNVVRVQGPPGSSIATAEDVFSRALYGRREASASFFADMDVVITASQLQAHANSAVGERSFPLVIPNVVCSPGRVRYEDIGLGDTVRFQADVGKYTRIDSAYRVIQIDTDIDENDNETHTLTLNLVV